MNPHGLHDDQHYTTADDLYKITKYAMTLPVFYGDLLENLLFNIPATNVSPEPRYVYTTNMLIEPNAGGSYYYPYCNGIKTGSHDQAGYNCLVSTAVKDGYSYMCIANEHWVPFANTAHGFAIIIGIMVIICVIILLLLRKKRIL